MAIPALKRNSLWLFVRACPQLPILSLSYPLSAPPNVTISPKKSGRYSVMLFKTQIITSSHLSQLWNMVHHLMNEVSVQQFHDVICAKFMNKKQKLFRFSIFDTKKNETAKSKLMQETRWRWLKTEIRSPRPERQRWCGQGFVCGFTFKLEISLSYVWKMKYDCEKHFCLIPQVGIIVDPSPAQPPSNHTSRTHSAQGVSTWYKHTHTGTDTHIQIHTHARTCKHTNTHTHPHAQSQLHSPHTKLRLHNH